MVIGQSLVSVTVGGTQREYIAGTISVENRVNGRSSGSVTIYDATGSIGQILRGTLVVITDLSDSTKIFSGYVSSATARNVTDSGTGRAVTINLKLMDQHYLADKRVVAASYRANVHSAKDIAQDLIGTGSHTVASGLNHSGAPLADEGVTEGTLDDGAILSETTANYITVSSLLDRIARRGSQFWYIDYDKQLHLRDKAHIKDAPFDIDLDNLGTTKILRKSIRVKTGNDKYRNKQILRGGTQVTETQTEEGILATGNRKTVTLGFPVGANFVPKVYVDDTFTNNNTTPPDGSFYLLKNGADNVNAGVKGKDSGKVFYYQIGDPVIEFDTALVAQSLVKVEYVGNFDLLATSEDDSEVTAQAAIEGGTSGIVESIIDANYVSSTTEATEEAAGYLSEFGEQGIVVEMDMFTKGLEPGMVVELNLPEYGITNEEALVESVETRVDKGYQYAIQYHVKFIASPLDGDWTDFFTAILNRQQSINEGFDVETIDQVEIVTILQQESATINIEEVTTQTAQSCPILGFSLPANLCGEFVGSV
jgi:hypothetical protein